MKGRIKYHKDGSRSYFLGGDKVTKEEFDSGIPDRTPDYQNGELPGLHADYGDWSQENGGRGRYCPQKAQFPKDPNGYAKSKNDLIDWAQRRGMGVQE
jgi:hypothetical protein